MGKGRAPCCDKSKVRSGPWSPAEDFILKNFIRIHGHANWRALPKQAGLLRCGKSCRLRWINYLRPDVKRGNFTSEEEQTIINMHNSIGKKWSKIASCLPGRTDNEIKNVWNTYLKKRLSKISTDADHSHRKSYDQTQESKILNCSSASSPRGSSSMTTSGDHENMEKSHFSNFSNEACSNSETSTNAYIADIEMPSAVSDFDFEFGELLESVENDDSVSVITENLDSKEEFRKSLRYLENELGLTIDDDAEKDHEMINFGPELDCSTTWLCSSPQHLGI